MLSSFIKILWLWKSPKILYFFSDELEREESNIPPDLNELHNENSPQLLKIFYVNINGLNNNKRKLKYLENIDDANLICFTETHLLKEEEELEIEDYIGYHTISVQMKSLTGRNTCTKGVGNKSQFILKTWMLWTMKTTVIFNDKDTLFILKLSCI